MDLEPGSPSRDHEGAPRGTREHQGAVGSTRLSRIPYIPHVNHMYKAIPYIPYVHHMHKTIKGDFSSKGSELPCGIRRHWVNP